MFDPGMLAGMSLQEMLAELERVRGRERSSASSKCKAGTCTNPDSAPLCPACFAKLGGKARKERVGPMMEELASPEADRIIMRWLQPLKEAGSARPIYAAVGAPLFTLLSKLLGPRCKDTTASVPACKGIHTLVRDLGATSAALAEPLLLPAIAEALRGGVSKLRYECMQLVYQLAVEAPTFPLREALYPPAGDLLGAIVEQLAIDPQRFLSELDEGPTEGAIQTIFWGPMMPPEVVKRYAPRLTAIIHEVAVQSIYLICKVISPIRRLRLQLASTLGLFPALLSLVNRPFPPAYPEDRSGVYAAGALRLLICAPPFADAALLAAGSDPAGDIAAGMLRAMNEAPNARKNAVRGAVAMCLHPADGPEPEEIEKAHASRRRQIEELAWCLAHLSALPEGARSALPHAPALRKVIAKAAEGEADPEAEAVRSPRAPMPKRHRFNLELSSFESFSWPRSSSS
eukprot:tig00020563_g11199.t1